MSSGSQVVQGEAMPPSSRRRTALPALPGALGPSSATGATALSKIRLIACFLLLLIGLTLATALPAYAQGPMVGGDPIDLPPLPSGRMLLPPVLPQWNILYLVGDLDSGGPATQFRIAEAQANVVELRGLGQVVQELYTPNATWAAVKAAALNADVLIYAGHGLYGWGGNPLAVGGMLLAPGEFVSPDQIRTELKLRAGGLVILNHVCFSAGTTSGDPPNVPLAEARRRASEFSRPFLDAGIASYYSSNHQGGPVWLVRELILNATMVDIYDTYYLNGARLDTADRGPHPILPAYDLWLDVDATAAGTGYHFAASGVSTAPPAQLVGGMPYHQFLPIVR